MSTLTPHKYEQIDFSHLKKLTGISEDQLAVHFGLYAGYVANTNKCNQLVAELATAGKTGTPEWAEINRRLGWEYNGMRLHEFYFSNLTAGGRGKPGTKFSEVVEKTFGSVEKWKEDFIACGTMRGIGWVIAYYDETAGVISNQFIAEHDMGHPAGFKPIVVMDVWEHAFMVDYKPADKKKYIEAFFANLDWDTVDSRI